MVYYRFDFSRYCGTDNFRSCRSTALCVSNQIFAQLLALPKCRLPICLRRVHVSVCVYAWLVCHPFATNRPTDFQSGSKWCKLKKCRYVYPRPQTHTETHSTWSNIAQYCRLVPACVHSASTTRMQPFRSAASPQFG